MNFNLYIEKVMFSKDFNDESYILNIPVVKKLFEKKELKFNKPVTFIVGENGTGKSTLLEAIAICAGFNAEGGS
jgi:predicted ATPase